MDAPLAIERRDADDAEQIQAEHHDERAAEPCDPDAVRQQQASQDSRRRTECHEDEREAADEQDGVNERGPARARQIVEAHTGDEGQVARDERQYTGREKAQ